MTLITLESLSFCPLCFYILNNRAFHRRCLLVICRQSLRLLVKAREVVDNAVVNGSVRPLSTPSARGKWTKDRNVFAKWSIVQSIICSIQPTICLFWIPGTRCRDLAWYFCVEKVTKEPSLFPRPHFPISKQLFALQFIFSITIGLATTMPSLPDYPSIDVQVLIQYFSVCSTLRVNSRTHAISATK